MSRVDDALLLRDTIQKIIEDKLGKTNPGASYATVIGFNPAAGTITVRYPGDDVDIEIPAGSIYPSEPGQIVRIDGPPGGRVVADVKGENLTEVKARTAQETADGKNTVNYGETPPEGTDHKDGDIWFDEGNSNMPNVWKDGGWVSIEDLRVSAIAEAQDELRQDLDTVVENGVGTKSFYKPTEPTAAESKEGDLWFDTSDSGNNELHTYVNGAWVSAADARIAAIQQAQTEMAGDITAAQQKADEAFQDAADADSKAATAQAKADLADDKAQAILKASNSIVPNGDFENQSPNIWPNTTYQANVSVVEADHARSGTHVMRMDSTTGNRYPLTDWRSSGEGRIYYAEVWVYHNDTDMTQRGRVSFYAEAEFKDGSTTGFYGRDLDDHYVYVYQDEMTPLAWNKVSAYITAPEGTINIRVAPHVLKNETPFDLDDLKVIDVTESISALREANQAKADADTAKTAADEAKSAAEAAQTAASGAQSTATEALTSANSKNTVTRSTANPPAIYVGRVDDIWWKMSTLASGGRVIAQYRWSGTAWLTETIDNAVIANLDAAKITTGYLNSARIQAGSLSADTVLVNGSLGSTIIANGAITTEKIAVGAITAESGVVASLDAGKITVGTLDVARLAANSITADKVLLGSGANLAPWDQVRRGETVAPHSTFSSGGTDGTIALAPGDSALGVPSHMEWTRSSTQNGSYGPILLAAPDDGRIPAEPGKSYTVNVTTYSNDLTCQSRLRIYWYGERASDGSYPYGGSVFSPSGEYFLSPTPTRRSISVKLPDDARYIMPMITTDGDFVDRRGTVHIVDWELKEAVGSTLIEPGAITTEKIATGAITAESGVIGSLDASKITVGKLSGARLEADAINGMQIIGATIATSTGFPRVQLDNDGLHVYKSSAIRSFFADATTGDLDIVGDFATATAGNERVLLSNSLWSSVDIQAPDGSITQGPGSGVRVGVDANYGLDLYHARKIISSVRNVETGTIRGPGGRTSIALSTQLLNGKDLTTVKATSTGTRGTAYLDATDNGFGSNWTAPTAVAGKAHPFISINGFSSESGKEGWPGGYDTRLSLQASSPLPPSKSATYSGARLVLDGCPNSAYSDSTPRITLTAYQPNDSLSAASFLEIGNAASLTSEDFIEIVSKTRAVYVDGGDTYPFYVNYTGSGTGFLAKFQKRGVDWGYIGSSAAMESDGFGIQSASGKSLYMRTQGGGEMYINSSSGSSARVQSMTIANTSGSVSSNASSVYVRPSSGVLMISSSSERYKEDIRDARDMPSILDIQARTWLDKGDIAESEELSAYREEVGEGPVPRDLADAPDEPRLNYGAIAEEVDSLGLHELVRYDVFNRPDGLSYEMFGVALIPEVRKLRDRITELEARLDTP